MKPYESQTDISAAAAKGTHQLSASRQRNHGVVIMVAVVLAVGYWTGLYLAEQQPLLAGSSDFSVWYSTGKMVLSGQSSTIYDYRAQVLAQQRVFGTTRSLMPPFTLGPYVLALFAPLAMLSYGHAILLWYVTNVVILLGIPFLFRQCFQLTSQQTALYLLGLSFFYPIAISLAQGQLTPLTLLIFSLVFLALQKRRECLAGSILGLALYKPHFVLALLLVFAFERNWKAIRGFLCTVIGLFAVSVMLVGWSSAVRFPQAILALSKLPPSISEPSGERMVNLRGLIQWFMEPHFPHSAAMLVAGIASLLLLLALVAVVQRQVDAELGFALIITVTVLASFHCYKHDMGLMILALFLTAHYLATHQLTNLRMALAATSGLVFFSPSLLPSPATVFVLLLFAILLSIENLRCVGDATPEWPPAIA